MNDPTAKVWRLEYLYSAFGPVEPHWHPEHNALSGKYRQTLADAISDLKELKSDRPNETFRLYNLISKDIIMGYVLE